MPHHRAYALGLCCLVAASVVVSRAAPQQTSPDRRAFWNKEFEEGKALLQKEAAPLLVDAVKGRAPGTALDLGMGEGRNALFLAANGWQVTGVDLSDVAVAQAAARARDRQLTLNTIVQDLDAYDMGTAQWDLVTSFYMHAWHRRSTTNVAGRIMQALKPGGLLVIEGFADPPNRLGFVPATLAAAFRTLRILRNDQVVDAAAWYVEEKTPLVRFVAEKPMTPSTAQAQTPPVYGPATGHLVLAGGGNLEGTDIRERFIALAGGADKSFVIVPTAAGTVDDNGAPVTFEEARVLAPWKTLGLRNVRVLHTHDPHVADSDAFAAPLGEADGVWFDGGRQWRLVDAYADTRTLAGFRDVLARGGVIGGSSAGATIQGQYLVRGATVGPDVVMTDEPNHQAGFAFLRRSAIDQHIDTRNRWNDLTPVMQRFPELLGIGLSEGTAIVVDGDRFEVIGRGKVAVHDTTHPTSAGQKPYLVLEPGAAYDMDARRVLGGKAATAATPQASGSLGGRVTADDRAGAR